jgi:hypothetical protein
MSTATAGRRRLRRGRFHSLVLDATVQPLDEPMDVAFGVITRSVGTVPPAQRELRGAGADFRNVQ